MQQTVGPESNGGVDKVCSLSSMMQDTSIGTFYSSCESMLCIMCLLYFFIL